MLRKITYTDKEDILGLTAVDNKNKVTAQDMNDIKNAINDNTDELDKIKVNKSGSNMTGALNFAQNVWNKFGTNVAVGAINANGALGIKGLDGPTAIQLVTQGASSNTDGVKWTCNKNGDSTISGTLHSNFNGPLTGNADTTTKLKTARTINDTSFDGTANITTTKWGTARNIYIADADNTNTGAAVSVNGGGNATLKLPATIKASLTGNASTATTLQTTRKINGTNFNGSADITTANWGTARDITVSDNSVTNTGPATSINGSTNYNIKLPATIKASLTGNASTASKLATARNIAISGAVTGNANFDGSGNININTTVNHGHNYVPLSGGTMSGMLQFNAGFGIQSTVADNDFWRILGGGSSNNGYLEIATADDGSEPIYLRQYTGVFSNLVRTATLLDGNGNTSFPGTVSASSFNGNANTATKATQDSAGQQINTTYIKGLSVSGRTITYTKGDGSTGTITTQDNNTTYPIGYKTIDANFASKYRTETKGNTNSGDYISTIRNDTSGVASSPQFGTGLAWGRGDTHGYLYMNYNNAEAYLGAGNVDKLNWTKRIMLAGDNASTATKLATARSINGTNFDGSANITTANWGTARNIYIADSDATNTGAAVSVNGSGNATLKLPATIKASLTGNASTASALQDYNSTSNTIQIGYSGSSLTSSEVAYLAAYKSGGKQIKDVPVSTVKTLMGIKNSTSNVTCYSSNWSGSAAPYTNTISVTGVTASNIVEVGLNNASATDAQVKACMKASIAKITQENGKIKLYAYGTKPTVNIPMTVAILTT